jgi:hypothetical protein
MNTENKGLNVSEVLKVAEVKPRRAGRPKKVITSGYMIAPEPTSTAIVAEKVVPPIAEAPKRVPIHRQKGFDYSTLNLDKIKYHYHWVNGTPPRMEQFFKAGYAQWPDKKGNPVSRRGKNDTNNQYLMFVDIETYRRDQLDKLEDIKSTEKLIRKDVVSSYSQALQNNNKFYETGTQIKDILHKEG